MTVPGWLYNCITTWYEWYKDGHPQLQALAALQADENGYLDAHNLGSGVVVQTEHHPNANGHLVAHSVDPKVAAQVQYHLSRMLMVVLQADQNDRS